jgi:S-methylmethionine-dependent homocysteine/selenocysteine methylase
MTRSTPSTRRGCDDATFGASDGGQTAEFDREAADFADAVASAIKAVEAAVPGALVVDVHREFEAAAAG